MYYSKTTGGFYDITIHGDNIPHDAVAITSAIHASLLMDQSDGKRIIPDGNGYPIAIDPPKPTITRSFLLGKVASKRWQVETGGVFIGGVPIATDRESQSQLSSSYNSLNNTLISDTPWKAADGNFILVTLADIEPIAQTVASHVRACFAAEYAHIQAIGALTTQAELDTYDVNTGWPE